MREDLPVNQVRDGSQGDELKSLRTVAGSPKATVPALWRLLAADKSPLILLRSCRRCCSTTRDSLKLRSKGTAHPGESSKLRASGEELPDGSGVYSRLAGPGVDN